MLGLRLFWSFFQIGLFSFGGGYAAMPLIKNQIVDLNHWLNMQEFADIVAISQMTPGPIAINASTFVGTRIAGIPGAIAATFGCILPSCMIMSLLAVFYLKHRKLELVQGILQSIRPAVVSLVAASGFSLVLLSFFGVNQLSMIRLSAVDWFAVGIFAAALILLRRFKPNPVFLILGAGVIGILVTMLM